MNETRPLEIQSRRIEGEPVSGPEALELEAARSGGGNAARLLQLDLQMHRDLLEWHRIEASAAGFSRRCADVMVAGADALIHEATSRPAAHPSAPVPSVPSAPSAPSVPGLAAPGLQTVSPLDRFRPDPRRARSSFPPAFWLALAIVPIAIAVGAWMWLPGPDRSPATVPVAAAAPMKDRIESGPSNEEKVASGKTGIPAGESSPLSGHPGAAAELEAQPELISLRATPDSQWEKTPATNASFPAEYHLRSGFAELTLADGTEILFQGPVLMTLDSLRAVRIGEGRVRVRPVPAESGFAIETPTVRLNGRDSVLAWLDVRPSEGTVVRVERGQLKARPWSDSHPEELVLAAGEMDQGVFSPAWQSGSDQPATAFTVNDDGEFDGIVDAADRPLRIASPLVFAQLLDTSRNMIGEDPRQFPAQWRGMVDGLENAVQDASVAINGEQFHPATSDQMLEQLLRIRQQLAAGNPAGGGSGDSAFSGSIQINGREQRFATPGEFHRAQQELFGPILERMMTGPGAASPAQNASPNGRPDGSPATSRPDAGRSLFGSGGSGFLPGPIQFPNQSGSQNSMSAFSGMINSNGQVMNFTTPEEFNREMQRLRPRR